MNQQRLDFSASKAEIGLTYEIVHIILFPRIQPKLLGRTNPLVKSNSLPLSSMRLRNATIPSIRDRVNLSTMSDNRNEQAGMQYQICLRTGTGYLEKAVFLEFLEDTAFNLDKLIGD